MLAGASSSDRADEIQPLLDATLDELGIPQPDSLPPWMRISSGGETFSRPPIDTIRFDIVPTFEDFRNFELLVYVNDVEMTLGGAGMGMDPFDILIPDNRLVATVDPRAVPIARCECGDYGCEATDVSIVRDGDKVHWDWLVEVPIDHGVTFPASQYDAEVARVHADHSWQRPQDTTARLIFERVDREALNAVGLTIGWVDVDYRDRSRLMVGLRTGDDFGDDVDYRVFLRFPWKDRALDDVADEVARTLVHPPTTWSATFRSTPPGVTAPPRMAGRRWRPEPIWQDLG